MSEYNNNGKTVQFQIESVLAKQKLILARRLAPIDFALGPESRLGSIRILHFDIPRKVGDDGSIDTDLFRFQLAEHPDPDLFPIDSVILFHE